MGSCTIVLPMYTATCFVHEYYYTVVNQLKYAEELVHSTAPYIQPATPSRRKEASGDSIYSIQNLLQKTGNVKAGFHVESLTTVARSVMFATIHKKSTEN